jgi:putative effector of murein hydrolase LrgA (UPF0299 family)
LLPYVTNMYYFSGIKQQQMKTALLAFAATFLTMAAADQENYLLALLLIPVSVYLILKTLQNHGH